MSFDFSPLFIIRLASSIVSFSTLPPPTVPNTSPLEEMNISEPTALGAEPRFSTILALIP